MFPIEVIIHENGAEYRDQTPYWNFACTHFSSKKLFKCEVPTGCAVICLDENRAEDQSTGKMLERTLKLRHGLVT